jgi:type I restriction enzyme, R subunit
VLRKATTLRAIQEIVEHKLDIMLKQNPLRMDYYKKYSEIVADYNREKDRLTLEETFAPLVEFANGLDNEQRRALRERHSEEELALFDLLGRENVTKAQRERLKDASRTLLDEL